MSASRLKESPLRPAEHLLPWAVGISILLHLLFYGGFSYGNRHGWWRKDLMPAWFKSTKQTLAEMKKLQPAQPVNQAQQEIPLLFVDVDPSTATKEAPKKPTHYSSRNSEAANPDVTIDSQVPKIDGKQTHVAKTQDTPRSRPVPLQPAAPKAPAAPTEDAAEEAKPKPKGGPKAGDLAMAKPAPQPGEGQAESSDTGEAPTPVHKRPHSLAEAKLQQQLAMPGQKMKQDGGVRRRLDISSLDALATPFGEYDAELIRAIQSRWDDLLDRKEFSRDRTGKVVITFNLKPDGRVTDVRVDESNVGDLLTYVCQRAILEPAPYREWPADMRRLLGNVDREIRFTFYYE